jgi:DNA-binding HxlR family transcriptional regulator
MSSLIQLREPPPRTATGRRPIMALDRTILQIASRPMRPVEIARELRNGAGGHRVWPSITTQRVAARLKALTTRGLVERTRPSGGPPNGPGTSLYRRKEDGSGDG